MHDEEVQTNALRRRSFLRDTPRYVKDGKLNLSAPCGTVSCPLPGFMCQVGWLRTLQPRVHATLLNTCSYYLSLSRTLLSSAIRDFVPRPDVQAYPLLSWSKPRTWIHAPAACAVAGCHLHCRGFHPSAELPALPLLHSGGNGLSGTQVGTCVQGCCTQPRL